MSHLNPSGICQCGCGQTTNIAKRTTNRLGVKKGDYFRYCWNHQLKTMKQKTRPLIERFLAKVDKKSDAECWLWLASKDREGYGTIGMGGHNGNVKKAHQVSYMLFIGPIRKGMDIDHLCRNRGCVNPTHLELVTHEENMRRCPIGANGLHLKGECKKGHKLTPDNIYYWQDRGRVHEHCRICRLEYGRLYRLKHPSRKRA